MSVIEAKIQTVEDMYGLIWTAVANKQPISAIYKERYRLLCPHRLGRNRLGQPACCAINTADPLASLQEERSSLDRAEERYSRTALRRVWPLGRPAGGGRVGRTAREGAAIREFFPAELQTESEAAII